MKGVSHEESSMLPSKPSFQCATCTHDDLYHTREVAACLELHTFCMVWWSRWNICTLAAKLLCLSLSCSISFRCSVYRYKEKIGPSLKFYNIIAYVVGLELIKAVMTKFEVSNIIYIFPSSDDCIPIFFLSKLYCEW